MKNKALILVWFLFSASSIFAQNAAQCIPVWQGFSQYWGYNHRINRLGDWLTLADSLLNCRPKAFHFAASGSGSDVAAVEQYYSVVKTDQAEFRSGFVDFEIVGLEGDFKAGNVTVEADFGKAFPENAHGEMILAGFDLHTKTGAKADKLVQFSIQIDSLLSSAENGKILAQIKYTLQLACSSAECEAFNQEVKYDLRVYWTAILGTGFLSKTETIDAGQTWEKKTPSKDTVPERLALSGNPNFPLMTVGIKGISMTLDAEHHILGWESWINPLSDFKNMLWLEAKLNFVQHQPSMYAAFKRNYTGFPKPPAKWVVHREAGQANWQMEICQLMFREAEINKSKVHSNVTWKTRHGKQKDVF